MGKPMTWNDRPIAPKDGTPVAVPTGAINFGEPGTNGQGDPDDERNSLLVGFKHE